MKKLLFAALAACAILATSCNKDEDIKVTNTLEIHGTVYKVADLVGAGWLKNGDITVDCDVHLEDADFMVWVYGVVGTWDLPSDNFGMSSNTSEFVFKSGTAKMKYDDGVLSVSVDATLSGGEKFKFSASGECYVDEGE